MTSAFFERLDRAIANYDLLCHPFYKAWSAGGLTRDDLRHYAQDYYYQVEAFPGYLAELGMRLEDGELRRAVLANMGEEKGAENEFGGPGVAHSELWLDFAEGMGAGRQLGGRRPPAGIEELTAFFHRVAGAGTPEEALAAFYAYESQVPRVAKEKARGLREMYGADEKTCGYFALHMTADVYHSQVWRRQLGKRLQANPAGEEKALAAGENAALALWGALDGIEARRRARAAA